jgi:hypothetical protein
VNAEDPSDLERLAVEIVPFEPAHAAGFAALVRDTLREFGFEPDAQVPGEGPPRQGRRRLLYELTIRV